MHNLLCECPILYLFVYKSRLLRSPLRRRHCPDAGAASHTRGDLQPQRPIRSAERGGAQFAVAVDWWDNAIRAGQ